MRFFLLLIIAITAFSQSPGAYVAVFPEGGGARVAPGSVILLSSPAMTIGPAKAQNFPGYPLKKNLAGTTVRIDVGTSSVDAYILATELNWVRALVPSETPLGDALVTVSYDGRSSAPTPIKVIAHAFGPYNGINATPNPPSFAIPRAVQNASLTGALTTNSATTPARPGGFLVLWGSGLGTAAADESQGPVPGDLGLASLRVYVGGKLAPVVYAGRSGCCAGVDQVVIAIPPDVQGCSVPVIVKSGDGAISEDVMVAINSGDGAKDQTCSDPFGLTAAEVQKAMGGSLRGVSIDVTNSDPSGSWSAIFGQAALTNRIPLGTCSFTTFGSNGVFGINAGEDFGPSLTITSFDDSRQTLTANRMNNNLYVANFTGEPTPGGYTVLDSPAASTRFAIGVVIPQLGFTLIAPDEVKASSLSEGLTIYWSASPSDHASVGFSGQFSIDDETCGGCGFFCMESADKGSFTIPGVILERGAAIRGGPNGLALYMAYRRWERFASPGFDIGQFTFGGWTHKGIAVTK